MSQVGVFGGLGGLAASAVVSVTLLSGCWSHAVQTDTLRWGGDRSGGGPHIYEKGSELVGFEVELADYLARQLGKRSEFVQGKWDKLPRLLNRGDIDLVLNGYEWSAEREQIWASTIPYYLYELVLLGRADDASLVGWDDLRARPGQSRKRVGVLSASAAERYVVKAFGDDVELMPFKDVTNVMRLVEQQQLDATVQDLPIAQHYGPEFPRLRRRGQPVEPGYYVIFVRRADTELRERLNQALRQARRDGTLRRIYEHYGIWTADQERLGEVAETWPPESPAAEESWADLLHYVLTLIAAAGTTVLLSSLSMPLAMLLGLLVAIGRLYGPRWLGPPLLGYVEFLRGTPLLLQLYVIYYVLPEYGVHLPAFWAGVLGLAINYSAYEAENYRAGLLAIPKGQMEAALALGMSKGTALRRVIVPQAVRIVIPPVTNDFIALFKDTSVCSVIAVTELSGRYDQLYNDHPRLVLELGLLAAGLYLLMSYPLSLLARRLERRFPRVLV